MKIIKQSYRIQAPLSEVWNALVTPTYINAWGGGPVNMDDKAGTKFSLWGGSIWGTNKKVIAHKLLVQEWFSEEEKKWEHPSIVTFTLTQQGDDIQLDLLQTDIPDEYAKSIEEGWKEYHRS